MLEFVPCHTIPSSLGHCVLHHSDSIYHHTLNFDRPFQYTNTLRRSLLVIKKMMLILGIAAAWVVHATAYSIGMGGAMVPNVSRRSFLSKTLASSVILGGSSLFVPERAFAAPEIFTSPSGIKYAVLKPPREKPSSLKGDIVAIEYTGYLSNGSIFDSTHAEGKKNALMFELGGNAVIDGINDMVSEMGIGEKRQVIMPPGKAFGDKGICIEEDGKEECLVKPGATLVYDITLKRTAIPPP